MFRTLFVALLSEAAEVHKRIDQALRASPEWVVTQSGPREFRPDEEDLAGRLSLTPPPSG
jgi:hypothetical protein